MERVLEVGEVVLAGLAGLRDAGLLDRDPRGQPRRLDIRTRPHHGIGLELDPDELQVGEPPSHGDEPATAAAVDVDGTPSPGQVGNELRQRGKRFLEEDRDVLGRQAFDGDAVAVRPVADRLAGPEEVDHPAPVERGDRGVDELAAQVVRPALVQEHDGHVLIDREAVAFERDEILGVGRPAPRLDRRHVAGRPLGKSLDRQPGGAGGPQGPEQAELEPEIDEPRAMEPAEGGDQVVEALVEGHLRRIVARPTAVASTGRVTVCLRDAADATVRLRAGFWGTMDTDSPLINALADDLDGTFESLVLAHQDRIYSIALRVLGDPRDAEEAAQDAFVRAYRALGGYEPERIRELRLRPWLATIVLNLCRSRLARRPAGTRTALSLDLALPGEVEPRTDEAHGPAAASAARASAREWAGLLLTLPPAYRSAVVLRHVDGLSYPELAVALDRPEGTVKAQVHRGLALLRTAFEAAQRREREEMTA